MCIKIKSKNKQKTPQPTNQTNKIPPPPRKTPLRVTPRNKIFPTPKYEKKTWLCYTTNNTQYSRMQHRKQCSARYKPTWFPLKWKKQQMLCLLTGWNALNFEVKRKIRHHRPSCKDSSHILHIKTRHNIHESIKTGYSVCCMLVVYRPTVYLMDESVQTIVRTATEIEVADQIYYLNQSQNTGTGPTSPSTDPKSQVPGKVVDNVLMQVTGTTRSTRKMPHGEIEVRIRMCCSRGRHLPTRPRSNKHRKHH